MTPMQQVQKEIRNLKKMNNELSSRMARMHMIGKVVEVKDNKVRLELLPPDGGKKFHSPWVRKQEEGGDGDGGYSSYTQAVIGQVFRLISPSGEISSSGSLAIPDGHTDKNPSPGEGLLKVFKHGDAKITMGGGQIILEVGGMKIVITADEIVTYGKTRLNDGNKKIHRVDDVDIANHKAVTGADEVFA